MVASDKRYHVGDNGPGECGVTVGTCPYDKDAPHYPTMQKARDQYEIMLAREHNGNIGSVHTKPTVELKGDLGNMTVEDGNLDDSKTRTALITGLCGDMAQAIRTKTGGDVYFVCYDYGKDEGEKFVNDISENPEKIHEVSTHAMIESPTTPGRWVDAYGHRSLADIEEFYGDDITVLKGTQGMLDSYSAGNADVLGNFADAALDLDREQKGFSYLTSFDV